MRKEAATCCSCATSLANPPGYGVAITWTEALTRGRRIDTVDGSFPRHDDMLQRCLQGLEHADNSVGPPTKS